MTTAGWAEVCQMCQDGGTTPQLSVLSSGFLLTIIDKDGRFREAILEVPPERLVTDSELRKMAEGLING